MTTSSDAAARDPIITVDGLSKRFKAHLALSDISFQIGRGEVFLLLGHNGAGKTTFLKLLLGLLKPTAGRMRVLGLDPSDYLEGCRARSRMGVMLEGNGLYERMTAWENLEIFARVYRLDPAGWKRRAEALLDDMVLSDRRHDPVRAWSAGMKRKLCFVRAVLHEPEILVLDEPTAGLDAVTRHTIRASLSRMVAQDGTTVVAASQDLAEAEHNASHTVFLRLGALVYAGSIAALSRQVRIRKFWMAPDTPSSQIAACFPGAAVASDEVTWQGRVVILRFCDGSAVTDAISPSNLPAGVDSIPVTLEDLYIELARDKGDI